MMQSDNRWYPIMMTREQWKACNEAMKYDDAHGQRQSLQDVIENLMTTFWLKSDNSKFKKMVEDPFEDVTAHFVCLIKLDERADLDLKMDKEYEEQAQAAQTLMAAPPPPPALPLQQPVPCPTWAKILTSASRLPSGTAPVPQTQAELVLSSYIEARMEFVTGLQTGEMLPEEEVREVKSELEQLDANFLKEWEVAKQDILKRVKVVHKTVKAGADIVTGLAEVLAKSHMGVLMVTGVGGLLTQAVRTGMMTELTRQLAQIDGVTLAMANMEATQILRSMGILKQDLFELTEENGKLVLTMASWTYKVFDLEHEGEVDSLGNTGPMYNMRANQDKRASLEASQLHLPVVLSSPTVRVVSLRAAQVCKARSMQPGTDCVMFGQTSIEQEAKLADHVPKPLPGQVGWCEGGNDFVTCLDAIQGKEPIATIPLSYSLALAQPGASHLGGPSLLEHLEGRQVGNVLACREHVNFGVDPIDTPRLSQSQGPGPRNQVNAVHAQWQPIGAGDCEILTIEEVGHGAVYASWAVDKVNQFRPAHEVSSLAVQDWFPVDHDGESRKPCVSNTTGFVSQRDEPAVG
ncbi:hypothetical protein FRC06_006505 [Ceratobasidium sp. 370]|nr:hypothetical protein FRC06_006505 [Ceratobasidium sp. 370]